MVRGANLGAALRALKVERTLSRADVAKITGLSRATVSSLVGQLLGAGLVREIGHRTGSVGRPGTLLEVNPLGGSVISMELGGDFVSARLSDFVATPIWQRRIGLAEDSALSVVFEVAIELATLAMDQAPAEVIGICVGVPGLVDVERGVLVYSSELDCAHAPVRSWLAGHLDAPIHVAEEANLSALGEVFTSNDGATEYSETDCADILYLSVGSGIHGGFVINGRLMSGHHGFAGSVGHMVVDPNGAMCRCGGRGCWDTRASQRALFERVHALGRNGVRSPLMRLTSYQLTVDRVVDAARAGDEVAITALDHVGWWLGQGIANLVTTLNPARVVLGGNISPAADLLIPSIEKVLRGSSLVWTAGPGQVLTALHGRDACLVGGVATILEGVLADPLPLLTGREAG